MTKNFRFEIYLAGFDFGVYPVKKGLLQHFRAVVNFARLRLVYIHLPPLELYCLSQTRCCSTATKYCDLDRLLTSVGQRFLCDLDSLFVWSPLLISKT